MLDKLFISYFYTKKVLILYLQYTRYIKKNESFTLVKDDDVGIVIFLCFTNLKCL